MIILILSFMTQTCLTNNVPLIEFKNELLFYSDKKNGLTLTVDGKALDIKEHCQHMPDGPIKTNYFGKIELAQNTLGYLYCYITDGDFYWHAIRIEPKPLIEETQKLALAGTHSWCDGGRAMASIIRRDPKTRNITVKIIESNYSSETDDNGNIDTSKEPSTSLEINENTWSNETKNWVTQPSSAEFPNETFKELQSP